VERTGETIFHGDPVIQDKNDRTRIAWRRTKVQANQKIKKIRENL
jgi:hypothetical protein